MFFKCTKIVFVYIWHKKHLLDYIKLTNKQAKPIKIHSNLGQIFFPKNNPIFLSVQLSEPWVISMKNSNSSQLIWGKISRQIKAKFCPNLTNRKMNFSKKKGSEMEDNQQRLPFFLRIHAPQWQISHKKVWFWNFPSNGKVLNIPFPMKFWKRKLC